MNREIHLVLAGLWFVFGLIYLITGQSADPWAAAIYLFLLGFHNIIFYRDRK